MHRLIRAPLAAVVLGLAIGSMQPLHAQGTGVQRTLLQKADTPDIPGHEAVMAIAQLPPGGMAGHHTHPGTELGYVLEGSLTLMVDGQPPRELKVGDSFVNLAGKPHNAKAGPAGAKILVTVVAEKGKPLSVPVP